MVRRRRAPRARASRAWSRLAGPRRAPPRQVAWQGPRLAGPRRAPPRQVAWLGVSPHAAGSTVGHSRPQRHSPGPAAGSTDASLTHSRFLRGLGFTQDPLAREVMLDLY